MNSKIKMLQTKPEIATLNSKPDQTKPLNPTNKNFNKTTTNSKGPRSPTAN